MPTKKPILSVVVDEFLKSKLEELSKEKKLSVSKLVSKLIEEALYLEENVFQNEIYKNVDWLSEEWKDKLPVLFTNVLDTTPDPIWIKDLNFRWIYVNQAFADLFGYKKEEMIGKTDWDLLPPDVAKECVYSDMVAINASDPIHSVEAVEKDGKVYYFDVIKTAVKDKKGKTIAILGISRDITELQEKNQELEKLYEQIKYLNEYDSLTGFYNKSKFLEILNEKIRNTKQKDLSFGLSLLYIDNIKEINEIYGFSVAESVLKEIANFIQNFLKIKDPKAIIGRISTDEFAIILDKENELVIKDLVNTLESLPFKSNSSYRFYPKLFAIYHNVTKGEKMEPEELLNILNIVLCKKEYGKFIYYDPDVKTIKNYAFLVKEENILKESLKKENFDTFITKIFDLKTLELKALEAFFRLKIGDKVYKIEDLVEAAIKTGLILQVDQKIITLINDFIPDVDEDKIIINFNPLVLTKLDELEQTLKDQINNINKKVVFEVNQAHIKDSINKIIELHKRFGFTFTITNCGTDYNFQVLLYLANQNMIDSIKFSANLIEGIENKLNQQALKPIISFAKDLGIRTVAPGIMSKKVFDICLDLGIECGEGIFFEKPVHMDDYKK